MDKAKLIENLKEIKYQFDSCKAPEESEGAIWLNYNEVCGLLTSLTAPVPDGIALNELGEFVEWVQQNSFREYNAGWCEIGGSNGWHCTTQELIKKFRDRNKLPKTPDAG